MLPVHGSRGIARILFHDYCSVIRTFMCQFFCFAESTQMGEMVGAQVKKNSVHLPSKFVSFLFLLMVSYKSFGRLLQECDYSFQSNHATFKYGNFYQGWSWHLSSAIDASTEPIARIPFHIITDHAGLDPLSQSSFVSSVCFYIFCPIAEEADIGQRAG